MTENQNEEYREFIAEMDEEALFADGYDDAIIGYATPWPARQVCVVYDAEKVIEILAEQMEDSEDPHTDAVEFFEFNTEGAYMGEHTPIFVYMKPVPDKPGLTATDLECWAKGFEEGVKACRDDKAESALMGILSTSIGYMAGKKMMDRMKDAESNR